MTATNPCGEAQALYTVTVCQPVEEAAFAWSPVTPTVGQTVFFTGTFLSGSLPITFSWDFGDGCFACGRVVTHTYLLPGEFSVRMTVTNGCGQAVVERPLLVVRPAWQVYLPLVEASVPR